ncbi:MAG: hypothetical protein AAF703_08145 [Cyanobacteria bacterium P01_D01_bin.105]
MDPLTIAVGALVFTASGIAAGATGKLGEDLMTKAQAWLAQLRVHSPETVRQLEGVGDPNVIEAEILEEVKQVSGAQPEVKAAMEATVEAAAVDSATFPNLTQLAEKIGNVNFGTIESQTINL